MFWSIFMQCSVMIATVVLIGGAIGWATQRRGPTR